MSGGKKIQLFDNVTVDGSSLPTVIDFASEMSDIEIVGTFGGGAVTIQRLSQDGTTWIDSRDLSRAVVSIDRNEIVPIVLPYGATIRLTLAGATSPDLDAWITRSGQRR